MSRVQYAELDSLLISPEIMLDPYPIYRRLREEAPVHWSESWNAWVVSRYADALPSLRDTENLSNVNRQGALFEHLPEEEQRQLQPLMHYFGQLDIIGSDPPEHTRFRALANRAFTPRVAESMRPRIQTLVDELLNVVQETGQMDLIHDLAHPLPIILIAELLGAPVQDRPKFRRWSAEILAFQGTGRTVFEVAYRSQNALLEMFGYMSDLIASRRREPQKDLLTALAMAEVQGERFSHDELLATCNTIMTAGHETTTNLIGSAVLLLLQNPQQRELLHSDPTLIGTTVEESLRFESPKQRNFRRVKRAFDFRGKQFEEGQLVFQLIGAANRDPEHFLDADRFDIRRKENAHLSFGHGNHFCVGAPLARMESTIAILTLFKRMPRLQLATDVVEWQERVQFRGPKVLPLLF
jgi:cytochrome P450